MAVDLAKIAASIRFSLVQFGSNVFLMAEPSSSTGILKTIHYVQMLPFRCYRSGVTNGVGPWCSNTSWCHRFRPSQTLSVDGIHSPSPPAIPFFRAARRRQFCLCRLEPHAHREFRPPAKYASTAKRSSSFPVP